MGLAGGIAWEELDRILEEAHNLAVDSHHRKIAEGIGVVGCSNLDSTCSLFVGSV